MYGQDMLYGISKVTFEIPHNITYSYYEIYDFYTRGTFKVLFDLRAHKHFLNTTLCPLHKHPHESDLGDSSLSIIMLRFSDVDLFLKQYM